MVHVLAPLLSVVILFIGMIVLGEIGRYCARRRVLRDPEGTWAATAVTEGAVFALLGLLLAFSFSSALTRFDARRALVIEETNAIGTAYLRLQILPEGAQSELREPFRDYLNSRITTYRLLPDVDAALSEFRHSRELQDQIWRKAKIAAEGSQAATMLLMPALDSMFDISTTRTLNALFIHPPWIVFASLFGVALTAATLAGYAMAKSSTRNWFHQLALAATTAGVIYVILDAEYPRLGLIGVDAIDQALVDLRDSMNE